MIATAARVHPEEHQDTRDEVGNPYSKRLHHDVVRKRSYALAERLCGAVGVLLGVCRGGAGRQIRLAVVEEIFDSAGALEGNTDGYKRGSDDEEDKKQDPGHHAGRHDERITRMVS